MRYRLGGGLAVFGLSVIGIAICWYASRKNEALATSEKVGQASLETTQQPDIATDPSDFPMSLPLRQAVLSILAPQPLGQLPETRSDFGLRMSFAYGSDKVEITPEADGEYYFFPGSSVRLDISPEKRSRLRVYWVQSQGQELVHELLADRIVEERTQLEIDEVDFANRRRGCFYSVATSVDSDRDRSELLIRYAAIPPIGDALHNAKVLFKSYEPSDEDMPAARERLFTICQVAGKFAESEKLYEDSRRLAEQRFGESSWQCQKLAAWVKHLRAVQNLTPENQLDYQRAVRRLGVTNHSVAAIKEFLRVTASLSEPQGDIFRLRTRLTLAKKTLRRDGASFAKFEDACGHIRVQMETLLGPDHAEVGELLRVQATALYTRGRIPEALKVAENAHRILLATYGASHRFTVDIASGLSHMHAYVGNYEQAELIRETLLAQLKVDIKQLRKRLAGLPIQSRLDRERRSFAERALGAATSAMGRERMYSGEFYRRMGNYWKALECLESSLPMIEMRDQPKVRIGLSYAYVDLRNFAMAEKEARRALKVAHQMRRASDAANACVALANSLFFQGKIDEAEQQHQKALGIYASIGASQDSLGSLLQAQLQRAVGRKERCLEIHARFRGAKTSSEFTQLHQTAGLVSESRSLAYFGEHGDAVQIADNALKTASDCVGSMILYCSEAHAVSLCQSINSHLGNYLSRIAELGAITESARANLAFKAVWRTKGLAGRRLVARRAVAQSGDARKLWEELSETRNQLAVTPTAELSERKERLEQKLGAIAAKHSGATSSRGDLSLLLRGLNEDKAVIELVCSHQPALAARTLPTLAQKYDAFIIRKQGETVNIKWVHLGDAEQINDLVKAHRHLASLASAKKDRGKMVPLEPAKDFPKTPNAAREKLYEMIWAKLSPAVGDAKTVVVCPDGLLNHVPWSALRAADGDFLSVKHQFVSANNTRDYLAGKAGETVSSSLALLVGDVAYGASGQPWALLKGTAAELDTVGELAREAQLEVATLRQKQATASSLCERMPRANFIHIGTHGAIKDEDHTPADPQSLIRYRSPLLHSSLVLANANCSEHSGGLLSAEQIVMLDLAGTRLVVLSACESGLGSVRNCEGVYGLPHSFLRAGAQAVVASLWKVDDDATAIFMQEFYSNLWQRDMGVAEAIQAAQKTLSADGYPPSVWGAWAVFGSPN